MLCWHGRISANPQCKNNRCFTDDKSNGNNNGQGNNKQDAECPTPVPPPAPFTVVSVQSGTVNASDATAAGGSTGALGRLDVWNGGMRSSACEIVVRVRYNDPNISPTTVNRFRVLQTAPASPPIYAVVFDLMNTYEVLLNFGTLSTSTTYTFVLQQWQNSAWV